MKYALLLFTGLVLMSCGVSRNSGRLRKVKVDRTPKETVQEKKHKRDWDAITANETVEFKEVVITDVNDEIEDVSVPSTLEVDEEIELMEGDFETEDSDIVMTVDSDNQKKVDSDNLSSSHRKIKRSNQRDLKNSFFLETSVVIGIVVLCLILAYLIIFLSSSLGTWGIVGVMLAAIVVYFLFFGPMVYE